MVTENEKKSAFFAKITGRVQGVGFRYSAIREANRLELYGWVRNTGSGDVEVWAEGQPEKLAQFGVWLRKGPQYAKIDSVTIEPAVPGSYTEFRVEY